jgi:imidazolonepropionase-like amidohydrolase
MASPAQPSDETIALICGRLIDAAMTESGRPGVIVARDGEIVEIRSGQVAPAGAETIDLSDLSCLPGLTDLHSHLMGQDPVQAFRRGGLGRSSAENVLLGLKNAQTMLHNGFTTLRVPGDSDHHFGAIALRDAIKAGLYQGPRMFVAPHMLSPLGGHSDLQGLPTDRGHVFSGKTVAAGVDNVREAVRRELKYGADWIKIAASGGVMSWDDDPEVQGFTDDEIAAFADETHRYGKKITGHIHGDAAALSAARSGFDSIEHGTMISTRTIEEMKRQGVVLVPTVFVIDWVLDRCDEGAVPEPMCDKARAVAEERDANVLAAYRAGVKIGYGVDQIFSHEHSLGEFEALVRVGITPRDAIAAATTVAAELLGVEDRAGTLRVGSWADVVAVEGDPLADISSMTRIRFVMMNGDVVRHDSVGMP